MYECDYAEEQYLRYRETVKPYIEKLDEAFGFALDVYEKLEIIKERPTYYQNGSVMANITDDELLGILSAIEEIKHHTKTNI